MQRAWDRRTARYVHAGLPLFRRPWCSSVRRRCRVESWSPRTAVRRFDWPYMVWRPDAPKGESAEGSSGTSRVDEYDAIERGMFHQWHSFILGDVVYRPGEHTTSSYSWGPFNGKHT